MPHQKGDGLTQTKKKSWAKILLALAPNDILLVIINNKMILQHYYGGCKVARRETFLLQITSRAISPSCKNDFFPPWY